MRNSQVQMLKWQHQMALLLLMDKQQSLLHSKTLQVFKSHRREEAQGTVSSNADAEAWNLAPAESAAGYWSPHFYQELQPLKTELKKFSKMAKVDLDGNAIKPMTICVIGAGGFIGSHLCETVIKATSHKIVAVEIYDGEIPRTAKIKHLLEPVESRLRMVFHGIKTADFPLVQGFIKNADLIVYLGCVACTPNNKARDNIYGYVTEAMQIVKYCSDNQKRLIHFSSAEVYGKTIGSYLPKDHPLREDPSLYLLKEDNSPCIFGSIEKQRWSYACAKQLVERLIYAEGVENGLEFTIVRPFNWIGPRMDFIPGVDGPRDGVPPVLTGFTYRLIRGESLKLVDGGESQRTFACINDGMEAVVLMIENPEKANGHIFNVGNPNNEVTIRQLAGMMTEVYAKVSGEEAIKKPTVDVSSKDFYGEGYDDSDKRIPDITIINRQLGWVPKKSLKDMLESFLTSQYSIYYDTVKALQIKENIDSLKEKNKRGEESKAKKRAEKKANNSAVKRSQILAGQETNAKNRVKGLDGLFLK